MNRRGAIKNNSIILTILLWSVGASMLFNLHGQNLKVHYGLSGDSQGSTSVIDESGNGYAASLTNGATISTYDGQTVIDLGTSNGYVDLGSSFGTAVASLADFSVMAKVFIPTTSSITGNGNFVWTFANSNDIANDAKGCLFYSAKNTRYAISPTNWSSESGISNSSAMTKGSWQTIIYVQRNAVGKIYINGQMIVSGDITMTPSELGATPYNYLGRSCYSGDAYLSNAKIADFRVYDGPLSTDQVEELSGISSEYYPTTVLAKFDFATAQDVDGNYTGTLNNGAEIISYGDGSVLRLGENNGYFNLSSGFGAQVATLDSFSISTNLLIPSTTDVSGNGNFVWCFANSDNMASAANGNLFFRAAQTRYAITETYWTSESTVSAGEQLPKGEWINLTYTQRNGNGRIYVNGDLIAEGTITVDPKDLGATAYNFLGRSCYSGDAYLKAACYDDFTLYQGVLKESDIWTICESLTPLNDVNDLITLNAAIESLTIADADQVRSSLLLPTTAGNGVTVSWVSGNTNVISNTGVVSRPAVGSDPVVVVMTATLTYNNVSGTKEIEVTVLPQYSDETSVNIDLENLSITGNINNIKSSIGLPIKTDEGSMVVWSSDSPEYLDNVGKVVQLSPTGNGKKKVILTATVIKGEESATKTFEVWVAEKEDRAAYLFSYFTGNDTDGEQIRFAVSNNGFDYTPLNNGQRIISSDTISLKGGVRDPHILRGEDGYFYMVVTDMKSAEGWSSNRGMVLLRSNDLVNWTHSTVHFPERWPDIWANVLRVWAPQTIYDPAVGKYMVYFSLYTGDATAPYDRVYYCYANEDFTDLEGEPQILFDRGTATIDGDIVFNDADNLYYMFFKNESLGGISQVTSSTLTQAEGEAPSSQWSDPTPPKQQTTLAVEGSGVFQLINSDDWVLMYDCYTSGHYQYCVSPDLQNFTYVQDNYSINARHGTTISLSQEELERIIAKWPSAALTNEPEGARNINIRNNGCEINTTDKVIKIAVNYGTDISSFDPELYASPGSVISPTGAQNFTNGAITYSFTQSGSTVTYQVNVAVEGNPVLPEFHADPDVLYSEKTGRFYIYPTTDGYAGWGGFSFDVFSSPDLVHWTNEGTILDLSTDQVSWATGNAWAPCIDEKKMADGSYKYYFYFSGNAGDKKEIGVAVANDPTGPFIDSGEPMISQLPDGIGGQLIDGDVFTDPVSGKSYFYYGNGFMAVAELNEDMISINESTVTVITPQGGSLSDYAFREAGYVFYRNGLYYFLWSVDDTGSPNYHVAYGTSTSPMGPINVAEEPIVIIQDADNELYGTAHNSILQIPGTDEWYIVYHRINANYLNNDPGVHREVCIDKLEFNEDGTIKQVVPTRAGIEPVILDHTISTGITDELKADGRKANGKVVSEEMYDLTGKKVSKKKNQKKGIYIVKETYENGVVITHKNFIVE
nr:family 43 glycosylhydrolase [uncultured Carboxylicivirga sp.]